MAIAHDITGSFAGLNSAAPDTNNFGADMTLRSTNSTTKCVVAQRHFICFR